MSIQQVEELIDVIFSREGCIWSKKQTLESMCPIFLEEAHELIEAIQSGDKKAIQEEMGDFIFNALFLMQVSENESFLSKKEVLEALVHKIVSRNVHVFGDEKVSTLEELGKLWEAVKAKEKKERKTAYAGVPRSLGALMRGQKILDRQLRSNPELIDNKEITTKKELKKGLANLICQAQKSGLDAELLLHELIEERKDAFFIEN